MVLPSLNPTPGKPYFRSPLGPTTPPHIFVILTLVELLNVLVAVQVPPFPPLMLEESTPPPFKINLYLPVESVLFASVVTPEQYLSKLPEYTTVPAAVESQVPLLQYGVAVGHWESAVQVAEQ